MAEPFSIAASALGIIRFAQELTKSIQIMRRFCESVKNAPTELQELVEHIGRSSDLIEAIAKESLLGDNETQSEVAFKESLFHCRQAVERVQRLADTMQDGMASRKFLMSWKIAFQRQERATLLAKLYSSREDLKMAYDLLANNTHKTILQTILMATNEIVAEQRSQTKAIQQLTVAAVGPPPDHDEQVSIAKQYKGMMRRGRPPYKIRRFTMTLPTWSCDRIWQLAFQRAAGQWTISLAISRDLPYSDELSDMIWCCDVVGLDRLLCTGELTVHDTLNGFSLLSVSRFRPFEERLLILNQRRQSLCTARSKWSNICSSMVLKSDS